jgi:hypothetical protein
LVKQKVGGAYAQGLFMYQSATQKYEEDGEEEN